MTKKITQKPPDFAVWERFLMFDNTIRFLLNLKADNSMSELDSLLTIRQLCDSIRSELHVLEVDHGYKFKQFQP